jgi:hypothetical protein
MLGKYKQVILSALLMCALLVSFFGKTDGQRSFAMGMTVAIVIVKIVEYTRRLKSARAKA